MLVATLKEKGFSIDFSSTETHPRKLYEIRLFKDGTTALLTATFEGISQNLENVLDTLHLKYILTLRAPKQGKRRP